MNEIQDIKNILIGLEARIKHIEKILDQKDKLAKNVEKALGDK